MSRRQFMAVMGGFACLPLFPGCMAKPEPITVGIHVWPGYEPTPLAQKMGWLDEKLVRLVQTGSATETLQLLKQGKIDAVGLTLDEVLRAREAGIPLAVILVCDISAGADQFVARPEFKTLADIRGLRIGVEEGGLGALMLYQVLQAAKLEPEDVIVVSLTPDNHVEAWKGNQIDAAVTYEPAASKIVELGGKKLFDSGKAPALIIDVLAVRTSLLDAAHSAALRNLVAAHLQALNFIEIHREDAAYQLAPRLNLPVDKVLGAFKGLVLPDLKNNIRLLATANPPMRNSAKLVADTMRKAGILKKPADLHDLIRPEYLPRDIP